MISLGEFAPNLRGWFRGKNVKICSGWIGRQWNAFHRLQPLRIIFQRLAEVLWCLSKIPESHLSRRTFVSCIRLWRNRLPSYDDSESTATAELKRNWDVNLNLNSTLKYQPLALREHTPDNMPVWSEDIYIIECMFYNASVTVRCYYCDIYDSVLLKHIICCARM